MSITPTRIEIRAKETVCPDGTWYHRARVLVTHPDGHVNVLRSGREQGSSGAYRVTASKLLVRNGYCPGLDPTLPPQRYCFEHGIELDYGLE